MHLNVSNAHPSRENDLKLCVTQSQYVTVNLKEGKRQVLPKFKLLLQISTDLKHISFHHLIKRYAETNCSNDLRLGFLTKKIDSLSKNDFGISKNGSNLFQKKFHFHLKKYETSKNLPISQYVHNIQFQ